MIDITVRALHRQGIRTGAKVIEAAVKSKQKEFATKDANGRKVAEVIVVPFVMTSMGNIDKGATKLLNSLSNRDPLKVKKLKDLISVQHAKWIAVRLRRCMGFHNRSIEESARRMYLQPPKGRRHDRSSQGSRGEFARLSNVLCQRSGPRATREEDTRVSGATAGARRGKGPVPKRLVKPKLCASPLHAGESAAESTPAETGWTTQRSVREELEGNGGALAALDLMQSFDDDKREPFSQIQTPFSRGISRAESAGGSAFSRSGEQHAP